MPPASPVHFGAPYLATTGRTQVNAYYSDRGWSQFYTSVPPDMHKTLTRAAALDGISRNALITRIIETWLRKPKPLIADYSAHDRVRLRFWADPALSKRIARFAKKSQSTRASVIYTALTHYQNKATR